MNQTQEESETTERLKTNRHSVCRYLNDFFCQSVWHFALMICLCEWRRQLISRQIKFNKYKEQYMPEKLCDQLESTRGRPETVNFFFKEKKKKVYTVLNLREM